MNIIKTNGFNVENAVSLRNHSLNKGEELKKIEEQAKEIIKNNPAVKFENDTSVSSPKLTVVDSGDIAPFEFINDIEELSSDEKDRIMKLIQESIKKPGAWAGDYYKMTRAQTGMQLQLITERLIPDKYKEQMGQAIQQYQEESYNYELKIQEALYRNVQKSPILRSKSKSFDEIKSFVNEQEKTIKGFYNELDLSNPAKFTESFEKMLANFKNHQQNLYNDSDKLLQGFQEELRTKWNDFISNFQEMQSFKLPTAQSPKYNFSV
ncbi:hypothetical protein [Lysinibacillus piscis]|uniref:Uncharacterized protein n=1 Tax=Lysinibacillus piscis TaxID=2518931 RepID=A0ABQ5NK89_9BACI|nr:hypothetical protein [Lysinibacillus sp. KH24]GLC88785.1 hypothetical protein LYSBPC_19120 [Lysinibacillus sp. KH24]